MRNSPKPAGGERRVVSCMDGPLDRLFLTVLDLRDFLGDFPDNLKPPLFALSHVAAFGGQVRSAVLVAALLLLGASPSRQRRPENV